MKNVIERNLANPQQIKLGNQLKIVVLTFLATVIPFNLIAALFYQAEKVSIGFLTRDPAAITQMPYYLGLFSNIGILLWCASTTICLFSSTILKKNPRYRELSQFLLYAGLFTGFLMLDDLFMFHESVIPRYLKVKESLSYVVYVLAVLFIFIKSIKVIKKTEFIILLAAVGFFALSIVGDRLHGIPFLAEQEELFKMIGISTWLIYLTRLCSREISNLFRLSSTTENF